MNKHTAFERYVVFVGGRGEAAKRLGISRGMVDHIVNGIRGVSVKVAKQVSEDTNGIIPLHDLRPDVWTRPDQQKAA